MVWDATAAVKSTVLPKWPLDQMRDDGHGPDLKNELKHWDGYPARPRPPRPTHARFRPSDVCFRSRTGRPQPTESVHLADDRFHFFERSRSSRPHRRRSDDAGRPSPPAACWTSAWSPNRSPAGGTREDECDRPRDAHQSTPSGSRISVAALAPPVGHRRCQLPANVPAVVRGECLIDGRLPHAIVTGHASGGQESLLAHAAQFFVRWRRGIVNRPRVVL